MSMAQEKKMSAREWANLASKTEPVTPDAGKEGTAVADFEVPLYDGGTFKTADFKDKITFLTFWYSTWGGCIAELPRLKTIADELNNDDFQILAIEINLDREGADKFIAKHGLDFTFGSADRIFVKKYFNAAGYPNSFIIGKDGKIIKHKAGFKVGDEVHLEEIFTDLLK